MLACAEANTLLTLWERALGQPPSARGEALLRASGTCETSRSLGERNCRLVELHSRLFGPEIALSSRCPACNTQVEFGTNGEALASRMRPRIDDASSLRFEAQEHSIEFRLPNGTDIERIGDEEGETFARRLLDSCVVACAKLGDPVSVCDLPVSVLDALSRHMEELDPGGSISFALVCPQCAGRWQARLDIQELVWKKVRSAAEQALLDIDSLARAYGWTEREVLALSPLRRAAYLQIVSA